MLKSGGYAWYFILTSRWESVGFVFKRSESVTVEHGFGVADSHSQPSVFSSDWQSEGSWMKAWATKEAHTRQIIILLFSIN